MAQFVDFVATLCCEQMCPHRLRLATTAGVFDGVRYPGVIFDAEGFFVVRPTSQGVSELHLVTPLWTSVSHAMAHASIGWVNYMWTQIDRQIAGSI